MGVEDNPTDFMADCGKCSLKQCPEKCFNEHPGSMIALRKVCDATGKRVHIIGEHDER